MPMEEETMGMLIAGFSIVMGISFVVLLWLMFSKERKPFKVAYAWVLGFFVFFSLAISQALQTLRFDINHPMASEEISLHLGITGGLWAISMLLLLLGLSKFSSAKKTSEETPK